MCLEFLKHYDVIDDEYHELHFKRTTSTLTVILIIIMNKC